MDPSRQVFGFRVAVEVSAFQGLSDRGFKV